MERFQVIGLLLLSNAFMTVAWYGHLRFGQLKWFEHAGLASFILISWGLAFFEYCFQVPANRYGHGQFSAAQLKTIQEIITLAVFCGFSVLYLKEPLRWNVLAGFAMIVGAAFLIFKDVPAR